MLQLGNRNMRTIALQFIALIVYLMNASNRSSVAAFQFRFETNFKQPRISEKIVTNSRRSGPMELSMAAQAFNPLLRWTNTHIRWYETDLQSFYEFVDSQPMLTKEQEFRYGKAIVMSKFIEEKLSRLEEEKGEEFETIEDVAKHMLCSATTLEKIVKYGEIAKRRLHDSNLKLVLAVVSRYRSNDLPLQELIGVGSRGLARAVLRYDYTKGFRFATYATWYVHQAVVDYVRWTKHLAKMPSRYLTYQRRLKQYVKEYKKEHTGQLPDVKQIAAHLNIDEIDVVKVSQMNQYPSLASQKFENDKNKNNNVDKPISEFIPSVMSGPLGRSSKREDRHDVEELMEANLSEVERDVLRLRLGLDDGRVKAVKEVGKKYKISWKKVSVVEKEAMSKLRDSTKLKEMELLTGAPSL